MRKTNFSRVSKAKEICIKCKCRSISGSGEGRKFNWCVICYEKVCCHIRRGAKKNAIPYTPPEPRIIVKSDESTKKPEHIPKLKEDSRYWKTMMIRLKSRFRAYAVMAYGKKCLRCGTEPTREPIEVDHIYPVSRFPQMAFDLMNTQVLCRDCNTKKSNKNCKDFRTDEQREKMRKIIECLPPGDQIMRVNLLRKDMKKYSEMTLREQVTGRTGKSS